LIFLEEINLSQFHKNKKNHIKIVGYIVMNVYVIGYLIHSDQNYQKLNSIICDINIDLLREDLQNQLLIVPSKTKIKSYDSTKLLPFFENKNNKKICYSHSNPIEKEIQFELSKLTLEKFLDKHKHIIPIQSMMEICLSKYDQSLNGKKNNKGNVNEEGNEYYCYDDDTHPTNNEKKEENENDDNDDDLKDYDFCDEHLEEGNKDEKKK